MQHLLGKLLVSDHHLLDRRRWLPSHARKRIAFDILPIVSDLFPLLASQLLQD